MTSFAKTSDLSMPLDPPLQDRVEDVRVVDVVEDHRGAVRRDPSGEALSDRDPHASSPTPTLELPITYARRASPSPVSGENRNRVGLEDIANARQQLGEELIEVEMGQRRVGDELKSS